MSTGSWDCHAHLFGPYDRFPLAADRSYTPPEAVASQYLSLLSRLGLSNGVLVHPSAYGDDFSLLFQALSRYENLRGVIVVRPGTLATLEGLRDQGIRAARFSHRSGAAANFAGSASFDDLLALAPALAAAGLHAELWTDCKALPDIASRLRELPVQVVIDHMGGFDEAMLKANPDSLVWGSDWPHLRVTPAPDAAQLLDALKRWTPDASLLHKILVSNPQALYA